MGGDCLADVGMLRGRADCVRVGGLRPDGFAASGEKTLAAIRAARPYDSNPTPEQWNPAAPRDDTRALSLPTFSPQHENGPPTPSADRHETSRLNRLGVGRYRRAVID